MKKTAFVLLLVLAFVSCTKNKPRSNAMVILPAHTWYPFQTEIVTVDSLTVTSPSGVVRTITKLDTVIHINGCLQQSDFTFQSNGSLHITSPCNAAPYDTAWKVTPGNFLFAALIAEPAVGEYYYEHFPFLFPFAGPDSSYYYYSTSGSITEIDDAHFVFNYPTATAQFDRSTVAADTSQRIVSKEFETYKSR